MRSDLPPPRGWLPRTCVLFETVAMLLVGVMTAFIVVQVLGRNLFNAGLPWAEELARYCGLGVVYLTVPLLLLKGGHIQVEWLPNVLGRRSAFVLKLVNELVVLAYCLFFLWGGWHFLKRAAHFSTAALGIPNWLYYLPAAVGMTLLTLVALSRLSALIYGRQPS
ncbi:TRAP transporter small permease [Azoarcus sp. L1K30]|uniref:TRAP transporter small permease n=1 Tax=Azoarcus sp. L1K30 TaxID=2820277 RepID=UPI001B810389|nr:TRAP transporter small permease [Azoarcus sp. L1K30]MBR0566528.1 TRAP transporter small permease [Azoarcus sp. L1K30]